MPSSLDSSFTDLLPVSYPDPDDNWAVNPLKAINAMETADEDQDEFTLDDLRRFAHKCTPALLAGLLLNDLGQYAHRICFALGLLPQLEVFKADSVFEEFWVPYSERAAPATAQAYCRLHPLTSHCVRLFAVEDAITNTLADTPLDIALTRDLLDFALWDLGHVKETSDYRSFVDITMPRSIIEAGQCLCDSGFLDQLMPDPSVFNMPITPPLASQPPITVLTSSPAPLPAAEVAEPRLSAVQKRLLHWQEHLAQAAPVRVPSPAPSAGPSDTVHSAEAGELVTATDDKDEIEVATVVKPAKTKGKGKRQASPLPQAQHANRPAALAARCSAPLNHYHCFWMHVNLNGLVKHPDATNYLREGGSIGVYHNSVGISLIDLPSLAPLVCLILVSRVLAFVEADPPIAWLNKESLEQRTAQLVFPSGLTIFPNLDELGNFLTPYTRKAMAAAQLLLATLGGDKLCRCLHRMFANSVIAKAATALANIESPNASRAPSVNTPAPSPAATPSKGKARAGPTPQPVCAKGKGSVTSSPVKPVSTKAGPSAASTSSSSLPQSRLLDRTAIADAITDLRIEANTETSLLYSHVVGLAELRAKETTITGLPFGHFAPPKGIVCPTVLTFEQLASTEHDGENKGIWELLRCG